MGKFGGYYKGEKKKKKKDRTKKSIDMQGLSSLSSESLVPQVEILGKSKKKHW